MWTQSLPDWIGAHVRTFAALGGGDSHARYWSGVQAAIRVQIASLGAYSLIIQPGSTTQSRVRYE